MTAATIKPARWRYALSGQALFFIALAVSVVLTAAFCWSVYGAAKRADQQTVQSVEAQVLRILEDSGASGLAAAFDSARRISLPGADQLELALWQVRGDTRRLILETSPGIADAFQSREPIARNDGVAHHVHTVDLVQASQNWALPMRDLELSFGFAQPTQEMQRAWSFITMIIAVSACVCAFIVFLQLVHWQQYRRSVQRMNTLLERYSNGETGIRFVDKNPAPELRELARQLNIVLPKIDGLFADLRALSAHLAHELRTPLQNIRSAVRKIVREDTKEARRDVAGRIDRDIDGADARLQTIMQLFRLQADADVAMDADTPLGTILEDLVYDFEEDLQRDGRTVEMQIDTSINVNGNAHLLELMIANLLSNAVKYASPATNICIDLNSTQNHFHLRVSNSGTLSDDLLTSAFDRYAQGAEHRSLTGFGLGLGLVRAIAQKHGFTVRLAPDPAAPDRIVASVDGEVQTDG